MSAARCRFLHYRAHGRAALLLLALLSATAAVEGVIPNIAYPDDQLYEQLGPRMGTMHTNQPCIVNGYVLISGNGAQELWDISDPQNPQRLAEMLSPHRDGEAEGHTVSVAKRADGTLLAVTISGRGIDIWDITDARDASLLAALELEGINYGDFSKSVWGVCWHGEHIYVGASNRGLIVVDASDPSAPQEVTRISRDDLGLRYIGPVISVGDRLVIGTNKVDAGVVLMDIADPANPVLLDVLTDLPDGSYIDWFYGDSIYFIEPIRRFQVLGNGDRISDEKWSLEVLSSEYLSFADGHLFLGHKGPKGLTKYRLQDDAPPEHISRIVTDSGDDQFSVPAGNLLVVGNDSGGGSGSFLVVHDTQPDTEGPRVLASRPTPGAVGVALQASIGLSFSDQIDVASATQDNVRLRKVDDGTVIPCLFSTWQTVLNISPSVPLEADADYELVVSTDGVSDPVGNGLAATYTLAFSTSSDDSGVPLECDFAAQPPAAVDTAVGWSADDLGDGTTYVWSFGDGNSRTTTVPDIEHSYSEPGRYQVELRVNREGRTGTCQQRQVIHRPITAADARHSSGLVHDAGRGRTWNVNPDNDSVAWSDPVSGKRLGVSDVGDHPISIDQAGDGSLWVACRDSAEIHILDPADGTEIEVIALPAASRPVAVICDDARGRNYVSLAALDRVAVFADDATLIEETQGAGDPGSPLLGGMALSHDGGELLVSRFISGPEVGTLYAFDAEPLDYRGRLTLPADAGPDTSDSGRGVPNYLAAPVFSPDGAAIFVPSKKDNTDRGLYRDDQALTFENTVRSVVTVLDNSDEQRPLADHWDIDDRSLASAAILSPRGDLLFVASVANRVIDVLDVYTGNLLGTLDTGLGASSLALTADGLLIAHAFLDRSLTVFDVSAMLAGGDVAAEPLATIDTVSDESLAPEVLAGKRLFYDASDVRMSRDGYIACASCHLDGGQDGRVWDFTDRGEGLRNTISLRGRSGMGHGPLHWTGNFDEVQDFELDIVNHFGGRGLIDDQSPHDSLDAANAGRSEGLDALTAYVNSLDTVPPSPYRASDGSLDASAISGRDLYERLNCASCHGGDAFTNSAAAQLYDVGTITPASGMRLGETLAGIDPPTLKGLWATAPYLHDGSAATLAEVFDEAPAHSAHGKVQGLDDTQREDLLAFLMQIDESEPAVLDLTTPELMGSSLTITGRVAPGSRSVAIGDATAEPSAEGYFSIAVPLEAGTEVLPVVVTSSAGEQSRSVLEVPAELRISN